MYFLDILWTDSKIIIVTIKWEISFTRHVIKYVSSKLRLNSGNINIKDDIFIIGEYISDMDMMVTNIRFTFEDLNFKVLNIKLENAPTNPAAVICQNVHGPCPRNIFDTNILIDPIKNDSVISRNIDDRIIIEVRGFMKGIK